MNPFRHFLPALLCAWVLSSSAAHAQSSPQQPHFDDASGTFAVNANITSVTFTSAGMAVEFDRHNGPGAWPNVVPTGWDGPIQYSVGLVIDTGRGWHAAAPIEFWRDRGPDGTGPLHEPNIPVCDAGAGQIACNWFYESRFGADLVGARPFPGARIGVYVAAGSVRNIDNGGVLVRERSNIVEVTIPHANELPKQFTFGVDQPPVVVPPPPPVDETLSMRVTRLDQEVGVLTVTLDEMRKAFIQLSRVYDELRSTLITVSAQAANAESRVQAIDGFLAAHPIPADCTSNVFGFAISCTLEFQR